MKRPPRLVIVAVVLAAAGGAAAWLLSGREDPGTIFVSGTIEAREADLGFQVPGLLERVAVREGDQITPGLELAALERSELLAERAIAEAQVAAAQAQLAESLAGSRAEEIRRSAAMLAVAEERRAATRRDVDRLEPLAKQSLVSRQAFDHAQSSFDVATGEAARAAEELKLLQAGTRPERIAAQRAALAQATAALAKIDAILAQTTIRAPFAGTVTVRHREPGEAISTGAPILTLQNLDDRWVRVYVPGDDIGRLSLGQCASIRADGFAERRYTGAISFISSVAEFTPRNVQSTKDRVRLVYEVRVRIEGDDAIDLKPGLPGDVTFGAPAALAAGGCPAPATLTAAD